MSKIEIQTTQNVAIDYEAGSLMDRVIGCILDFVVVAISSLILWLLLLSITGSEILSVILILPITVFYSLAFEVFNNGKTLGKMAMGLQVVRLDGQEARLNDFLTRWVFRSIDITGTFGTLAVIMVTVTKNHQRLGDFVANTVVIKTKPTYAIDLDNVLKKKSAEGYEPVYPQSLRFTEDQMLILKSSIDRYQKYPNEAHTEVIKTLSKQVAVKMEIPEPKKKLDFLKQVLKDYVILTR
ncbi:MAG: RDD family protein [Cytophaga sp.]|uniref:RDD family protein n=1 Tax=Cytophaga sp. TaxID=29535 RepID=UPI003F7EF0C7